MICRRRPADLNFPPASRRVLLAAVLAAGALTGCGVSSDPRQAVVSAARTTLSQGLVSTLTLRDASALGAPHATVVVQSASLFSAGLGYAAVDLSAVADVHPGVEYLVFLPGTVYVMPIAGPAAGLPKSKTWVSIPLAPSPRIGGAFPRLAAQLEGLNPELLLDELAWGATGARHIGEPVVDHLPLSEYLVTVDLHRAAAAAAGPSAAPMRSAITEQLAALRAAQPGAGSVSVRVWVDGPGRIARLESSLPGSDLGTVSIALSQFGAELGRSLPLPAQVVSLNALVPAGVKPPPSPLAFGIR